MGSSESTKKLTMEKSGDEQSPGIVRVSERVVRRLRGEQELPLKETDEISRDEINRLWRELQEEKTMLNHQKEHLQQFMQNAFDQGRQAENRRLKEGKVVTGDTDTQQIDNHWRKVLEEKESDASIRENKLVERVNALKKEIADKEGLTIDKFNQAVEDAKQKFSPRPRISGCQHLQNEVLNCYKKHPTQALRCSQEVRDFISCVEKSQMDLPESNS